MSVLSWQAGNASGSFLTGTIVQALLGVNDPTYEPTNWQGTLFVFAMVLILFLFNVFGAQLWPKIQNGLMVLHVLGFLVVVIVLWVMAPHQSAKAVFTEFTNEGGWPTMGLSLMVGQITGIYSLIGKSRSPNITTFSRPSPNDNARLGCNSSHGRRSERCRSIRAHIDILELYR